MPRSVSASPPLRPVAPVSPGARETQRFAPLRAWGPQTVVVVQVAGPGAIPWAPPPAPLRDPPLLRQRIEYARLFADAWRPPAPPVSAEARRKAIGYYQREE